MNVYIKRCLKKIRIDIILRILQSLFAVSVFIIRYKKSEDLTYTNTILASVKRFGSPDYYSMYIKGNVIYLPLFVATIYIVQYLIDHYVDLNRRIKLCSAFLALFMAIGRIVSDSYYYVASWGFLTHATRVSASLLIGWFIILWKIINALFTYLLKCQNNEKRIAALEKIEKQFGEKKLFFLIWGSFLLCWLPRLLLKYPFYIDWDTITILRDVITGTKTTGYTGQMYIMAFFLKLGEWIGSEYNALFIYMFMMYFFSTLLNSFIFFYFQQKRIPKGLWYIVLMVVMFYPLTQDWATLVSKDANYAIAVISFVLEIYIYLFDKAFVQRHKRSFYLLWIVSTCGVLFFRMNGIFLVVPTLFFTFITMLRQNKAVKKYIIGFKRQIVLVMGIMLSIIIFMVMPRFISAAPSSSDGYFGYALKYYLQGRVSRFACEMYARKAAAIVEEGEEEGANEISAILDDDYVTFLSAQYGYGTGWTYTSGFKPDKFNNLTMYLIKNDTKLCLEATIAILFGHFDFLRGNFYYYGKNEAFTRYGMDSWYDQVVKYADHYSLLRDSDATVRDIPILNKLDNVGLYILLMIVASVFLVMTRGKRILIVYLPLYITLIGSCLSSYNAYIRMCAPIVLSMPILLFMCSIRND